MLFLLGRLEKAGSLRMSKLFILSLPLTVQISSSSILAHCCCWDDCYSFSTWKHGKGKLLAVGGIPISVGGDVLVMSPPDVWGKCQLWLGAITAQLSSQHHNISHSRALCTNGTAGMCNYYVTEMSEHYNYNVKMKKVSILVRDKSVFMIKQIFENVFLVIHMRSKITLRQTATDRRDFVRVKLIFE